MWTPEEEEALRQGVQKHGIGSWEVIRQDTSFSNLLWWVTKSFNRQRADFHRVQGRSSLHNNGPLGFFHVNQNFSAGPRRRIVMLILDGHLLLEYNQTVLWHPHAPLGLCMSGRASDLTYYCTPCL